MGKWCIWALAVACLCGMAVGAPAQKGVRLVKTEYKGWPSCYRMSNGQIELVATADVGPRVIRLGFAGGQNVFGEFADQVGKTGGDQWRIYGGHRLWHAPEAKPRTYWPDNSPIQAQERGSTLTLSQPTEGSTGIAKQMVVSMDVGRNRVVVLHRLRNDNLWAVELAPWALSMMTTKGLAIIPQAPYAPHEQSLLPVRPLVQWSYTDMADPRWRWGKRYLTLRQDPAATGPQKLGIGNQEHWAAYAVEGTLFIKTFRYQPGARYPDQGCSVEIFTNPEMLELETMGPLVTLAPGEAVEYREEWFLFQGVPVTNDDASLDALVLPRVQEALAAWGK